MLPRKGPRFKKVQNMCQILAVFGATGQQGGSVINYVLKDSELSQKYKIRAITRDAKSEKATQLKEKVEVVQGDVLDPASLKIALNGAHTVFVMTMPSFGPDGLEVEYNSSKMIADVAVEKGAEYIVFSTLPPVKEISGGKYTEVTPFDAKAKAEQYIRGLHIKSAFYSPGYFMENFQSPIFGPRQAPDGTWVLACHISSKTLLPYIDAVGDTGKFVGAILAEPDRYQGKTFCAAAALYSWEEVASIMSKTTGKNIIYKQIPLAEFKKSLPFEASITDIHAEGLSFQEESGYFGPGSEKLVAWVVENARGRLCTMKEYLETHPLQLA